jgi:hypothetical protein
MEEKMYNQEKYLAKKEYSQKLVLSPESNLVLELETSKKKILKLREGFLKAKVNSQARFLYQQKLVEESERALKIMDELKTQRQIAQHRKAS